MLGNSSIRSHQGSMYQSGFVSPVLVSRSRLENLNCIFESTPTMGALYLGDVVSTMKQDLLKRHAINAVLTCMSDRMFCLIKESTWQCQWLITRSSSFTTLLNSQSVSISTKLLLGSRQTDRREITSWFTATRECPVRPQLSSLT